MKKVFAVGTFVFGVFMFAQAQSTTTTAPKQNQAPLKEAPKPAGTTGNDAAGLRVNDRPATTTTTPEASKQTTNNDLQPSTTAPTTTRVINDNNRVNINGTAPVQSQPVVKPNTAAPKN